MAVEAGLLPGAATAPRTIRMLLGSVGVFERYLSSGVAAGESRRARV